MEDLGEDGRVIFKQQLTEMGYGADKRMKVAHKRMKVAHNGLAWQALIKHCSMKGKELG